MTRYLGLYVKLKVCADISPGGGGRSRKLREDLQRERTRTRRTAATAEEALEECYGVFLLGFLATYNSIIIFLEVMWEHSAMGYYPILHCQGSSIDVQSTLVWLPCSYQQLAIVG